MKNSKLEGPSVRVLAAAIGVVCASSNLYAQEAVENRIGLEEIIVTAQKREQGLQDVAASVSALSGESLTARGLEGIQDYSNFVPGMIFSGTAFVGERSGPDITVRGVANSRLFDMETSIATATTGFIYGQMPAYSFNPRLMDVKRVEVLKGPQGTLYGAASMGGTVKVIPNEPDVGGFTGKISTGLGYTTDGAENSELSGVVNIPLIEDILAVRMSAYSFTDSGFIDARMVTGNPNAQRGGSALGSGASGPINGNDVVIYNVGESSPNVIENINDVETVGGQFAAKYTPSEKFDATLSVFFQSKDEGSLGNYEPSLSSSMNERTTELFILQPSSTEYAISQLELRYDLGFAELHSVTGKLNRTFTNATDFSAIVHGSLGGDDNTQVPGTAPVNFKADIDVFSQEIRLDGSADMLSGLNWSVGYFYQKEDRLATGAVPVSPSWMASGGANDLLPPSGTRWVWAGEYDSDYENNSLFVDLSLSLTDSIVFSVGARNSKQDLSSTRRDFGNVFAGASTPDGYTLASQKIDEDQTTTRMALTWNQSDDVMIYASAAEGFRIGGANPAGNLSTTGCQNALNQLGITDAGAFESDSVWNYELGAKTQFADNRIQLNASVFQIDWEDLQVSTSLSAFDDTCGASIVANVGAAEIRGVEVELTAIVGDKWQVGLVAESNDHELTKGNAGVPGAQPGDPLKNIPDFAVSIGVQYDLTAIAGNDSYIRVDYVHSDERSFSDVAAGPSDAFNLEAYDLLNLRLGASYEDWDFTAFIDNLTDEITHLGVTSLPGGPGVYSNGDSSQRFVSTGRPRTFGLKISKSF